ncbi:MAG TPA: PDZ domain-containing protein [Gemmatimonadota bacterium]|nr:PDZ domain-containing protein [Gemmatimonadota bacterium]
MRRMIASLAWLAVLACTAGSATAQEPAMRDTIRYRLSWKNPASQLYTVEVTAATSGEPVVFSLPAWRPGRYILQNYAANVQAVRAFDAEGRPLRVEWVDLDSWRVDPDGASEVTLAYEWTASTLDAGSSLLLPDVAYFNPVNLLPWVEGRMDRPARLTLGLPDDWPVATQLQRGPGGDFVAADYHDLVDAPTIAAPDLVRWDFHHDDVPYHVVFRVVSGELDLGDYTQEGILADIEAIAREQTAMFGGAPYDEYWFLYQLVPHPFGHAVEHAASSSYVLHDVVFQSERGYHGFLGITAHELFHVWNVKRIRPAALWPYDYSEPQLTRLHWFTEGVTSYYDNLTLARTGLLTEEEYYAALAGNIQSLDDSPGRHVTSASLASLTSWHSGYGAGNPNQSISFYTKGALIGLLLDLTIRDATDGARSLDDVMRGLWERYYLEDRGVPEDGVQQMAEEVSGRPLADFFAAYVHGTEELPYEESLAVVGLTARQVADTSRPAATLGLTVRRQGDDWTVTNVLPASPALAAGVLRGDVLVAVDGSALEETGLPAVLAEHEPDEEVTVTIRRHGEISDLTATLAGGRDLRWEVVPVESPDERQLRHRQSWLAASTGRAGGGGGR